ncbi:MAG: ubiquinone/menaquinone biosynthesis C-methylase UbiE [Halieaceae bacterium]|jgi:ubiquinone/menaquinone biosynthesis C-methylase UbiE
MKHMRVAGFKKLLPVSTLLCLTLSFSVWAEPPVVDDDTSTDYVLTSPSRDGIGKLYMGRKIARVMGHQGAAWLERENRERQERTDLLIAQLGLQATDVVADIGAGTGYFSFRMSPLVPSGKVLAVDLQQEMLDIIKARSGAAEKNIVPVLGSITDINVTENSVDLILLVDAYHEFSHPREMGESMFRALKPGGRIALVEYRAEDPSVSIKPLHKMSESQAIREMSALGLRWLVTVDSLPQQHLIFFTKNE